MFRNINFNPVTHLKDNTVNFSSKSPAAPSPPVLIYARLAEFPSAVKKKNTELMHKFGGKKPSGKLQPGHIVPFSKTNIFSGFRLGTG